MTIFKPKHYNAVKVETNVGNVVASQDTMCGYVGKIDKFTDTSVTPNVVYDRAFVPLTGADLETDNIYVALFTPLEQDKFEVKNDNGTMTYDYKKKKGEHIRIFQATRHQMNEFEITTNIVKTAYATVNKNDVLVPTTDGTMLWEVGATATKAGMKVLDKDNLVSGSIYFGGKYSGSFHTQLITQ